VRILRHPEEWTAAGGGPVSLALGVFDGVHRGHQEVIRRLLDQARASNTSAIVATFDPHPAAVINPRRAPKLLQTLNQRLRTLQSLQPDALWLIHFDETLSRLTGEEFVRQCARGFGSIRSIHVGESFHFGHRRTGNITLLRHLAGALGFVADAAPPVAWHGAPISSTRIRNAISQGDLRAAEALLGRPFAIAGTVVVGRRRGRTFGYPTANLDVTGRALPPLGVYAGRARRADASYPAVANLGIQPTLANVNPALQLEVHLLDFTGDLYGEELEFTVAARLREERRFASIEELKAQIARDVQAARQHLDH